MKRRIANFQIDVRELEPETKFKWGEYSTTITDLRSRKKVHFQTETESGASYKVVEFLATMTRKDGTLRELIEDREI